MSEEITGMCEKCGEVPAIIQTGRKTRIISVGDEDPVEKEKDDSINLCEGCAKADVEEFLESQDLNQVRIVIDPGGGIEDLPEEVVESLRTMGFAPVAAERSNGNALSDEELRDLGFTEDEIASARNPYKDSIEETMSNLLNTSGEQIKNMLDQVISNNKE